MVAKWGRVEYGGAKWRKRGVTWDVLGHPHASPGRQGPALPPGEVQRRAVGGACGDTRAGALPLRLAAAPSSARSPSELRQAPVTNRSARDFMRMLFAGASAEAADKQGRVTLPPMLRDYAGLHRDCVVIGAGQPGRDLGRRRPGTTYSAEQEAAFADWSEEVFPSTDGVLRPASSYDRGLRPAPSLMLAHLPRCQTSHGGADGDLAARTAVAATPPHHFAPRQQHTVQAGDRTTATDRPVTANSSQPQKHEGSRHVELGSDAAPDGGTAGTPGP